MSAISPVETKLLVGPLSLIHRPSRNLLIVAIDADHPDVPGFGWAQHLTFVLPAEWDCTCPSHDFQPHLTNAARTRREGFGPLTLQSLLGFLAFFEARLVVRWRENTFAAELGEIEDAGLRVVLPMTDSSGLRTLFEPRKARGKRRKYGVKYDHEFDELAAVVNQEAEQLTVLPTTLLDRADIQTPLMVVDEDGAVVAWLGYLRDGFDEPCPQWIFTPLSSMSAETFWQDVIDYAGVEFGGVVRRIAAALGLKLGRGI